MTTSSASNNYSTQNSLSEKDQYAVFGNPISHSKSPLIHTSFAQQTQQLLSYKAILLPEDGFEKGAAEFFAQGGKGANVTVPFKLNALVFAQQLTPIAKRAGAVNTLAVQEDGSILGHNTDGEGLVTDLTANLGFNLAGAKVLLVGAGGAARGVVEPLLAAGISQLVIANRTPARAENLITIFQRLIATHESTRLTAANWQDLAQLVALGQRFDLVINATSSSLSDELPPLPEALFAPNALAYDLMYAQEPTRFLRWAKQQGASQQADGLGMLVEQAAASFALWRGVKPATAEILAQLKQT